MDIAVDQLPQELQVVLLDDASFGSDAPQGAREPHRHDYHAGRCSSSHTAIQHPAPRVGIRFNCSVRSVLDRRLGTGNPTAILALASL